MELFEEIRAFRGPLLSGWQARPVAGRSRIVPQEMGRPRSVGFALLTVIRGSQLEW